MITTLSTSLCWATCSPSDYEEKDSLVVIEAENLAYHSDWVNTDTILDFTGNGYIQWEGIQNYGKVENGIIDISIKINTSGTYRFMHRVAIADMSEGTTEHNDSWLKIEANDFFAEREGHIVKPNPLCTTDSTIDCPEGKSDKGYFKMYGGNSTWKWAGNTNDNSTHQIFATFDTVGTYKLSIAARSSYQAIDRMILFHIDKDTKLAQDLNQPETNHKYTPKAF